MRVGAAQGIPQLNPVIRTFAWEEVLFPLLWAGLTKWTPSGATAPDLATSWVGSKDSKTWTFKLRSGVKFSNGDPLTATDVVKTFNYYLAPKTVSQETNRINMVRSVTAVNPTTVLFRLKTANALFPTAIINVKIVKTDDLANFSKNPITTGPYKVANFVPDSSVSLVRNDGYFGAKAKLDRIEIVRAADPTAATAALLSGDLDVMWGLPALQAKKVSEDPGGSVKLVTPRAASQSPFWEADTTSPPFNNVKNRQALAYAIDRQTILKTAFAGLGVVSPTNTLLSVNNPSYGAPAGSKLINYSYNLAKAKKLFAEGGLKAGATLTWWSTPALPEFRDPGSDPPGKPRQDRHQARDREQRGRHLGGEVLSGRKEIPRPDRPEREFRARSRRRTISTSTCRSAVNATGLRRTSTGSTRRQFRRPTRRSGSRPGIRSRRSRTARCRSGCRSRLRLLPRSGRASRAPGSRAAASFISRAPQTAAKEARIGS